MKVYNKIENLIGNTPLFYPQKLLKKLGVNAKIYLKLECFNPAGSIKDRVALNMLNQAEKDGVISDGATIIEPTSGNTGIGLACICASRGYKLILTMPNTMSEERITILKAYGAQVELTDGAKGMSGAIARAKQLNEQIENSFIPSQFDNKANPDAHYQTTAPEIYDQLDGDIDVYVAGIGTGGTLSGAGKYLKEKNSSIKVIGVEPFSSPLITKGYAGAHGLQGIGANFIPDNFDSSVVDEVLTVKDEDAFRFSKMLATEEGLLVGITAGANLFACVELAKEQKNKGKTIVTVMPDSGSRYLSTKLFK